MVKVDIIFKVEFKLVAYSKEYDNGFRDDKIEIADVEKILESRLDKGRKYNFSTKWYKDVVLKNYDEKYIRNSYNLDYLFERIEHSSDVKKLRNEIIDELIENDNFLLYIGKKRDEPTTLFGYQIFKGSQYNHLVSDFEFYIKNKLRRSKDDIKYDDWDIISKVVNYEIKYK